MEAVKGWAVEGCVCNASGGIVVYGQDASVQVNKQHCLLEASRSNWARLPLASSCCIACVAQGPQPVAQQGRLI